MATRRILWVFVGILGVLVLSGSATVAWLLLRPKTAGIHLVVTSDDDRIRIIEGGSERVLDSKVNAQEFRFPAASHDGRKLAYVVADGDTMRIIRLDLASGKRTELYHSANRKPFDLAWSPDGRFVIFLAGSSSGISTQIVPDDGSQTVQLVATGRETYFAWSPDSSAMLLHVDGHAVQGGRVELYQTGKQTAAPLLSDPGFFNSPAWSLDGTHLFYVAQPPITATPPSFDDIQGDIVRVTSDGKQPKVLVSVKTATLRMVRAPTSDQIAYTSAAVSEAGMGDWGALNIVDGNTGESRTLSPAEAHVAAFFWSPDGKQIAYLTYGGNYALSSTRTWHVADVSSGTVRDFAEFAPSEEFMGLEHFFDAYLFSLSPWSPDSAKLAYGTNDGVYVLNLANGKATRAAAGTMGVWVGGK